MITSGEGSRIMWDKSGLYAGSRGNNEHRAISDSYRIQRYLNIYLSRTQGLIRRWTRWHPEPSTAKPTSEPSLQPWIAPRGLTTHSKTRAGIKAHHPSAPTSLQGMISMALPIPEFIADMPILPMQREMIRYPSMSDQTVSKIATPERKRCQVAKWSLRTREVIHPQGAADHLATLFILVWRLILCIALELWPSSAVSSALVSLSRLPISTPEITLPMSQRVQISSTPCCLLFSFPTYLPFFCSLYASSWALWLVWIWLKTAESIFRDG